ncbi:hypothetical protein DVR12_25825 [Chitinophaga silvatica]|uniref:Uncharacterized protein n=1 Tax=Chitinophaga silvatica TaxID=2282649 RepID=A0A3E1Y2Y3_9BACT|nr:hypothetical protein [Chitinophaga silvatica]RFS19022.1 hypothetical protein DVR12_25825 [Chitinophaga silvatica]
MKDFKLDRSAFKIQSFEEAENRNIFSKDTPYAERLRQAYYLISQAYGFTMQNQPKLDKNYFIIKKFGR